MLTTTRPSPRSASALPNWKPNLKINNPHESPPAPCPLIARAITLLEIEPATVRRLQLRVTLTNSLVLLLSNH